MPARPLQSCCCPSCAIEKARDDLEKKKQKALALRKRGIMRRTDRLDEAQTAFNAFIRYRDRNEPCIVCGARHPAQYQAGHYYTRKARPDLRFTETNCFAQCSQTNKYTSTDTAEKFKANVIARIGQEEFGKLAVRGRSDWTDEEIDEIKQFYRAKLKELKRNEEDTRCR